MRTRVLLRVIPILRIRIWRLCYQSWVLNTPSTRVPSGSLGDCSSPNGQVLPDRHLELPASLLCFNNCSDTRLPFVCLLVLHLRNSAVGFLLFLPVFFLRLQLCRNKADVCGIPGNVWKCKPVHAVACAVFTEALFFDNPIELCVALKTSLYSVSFHDPL